MSVDATVLALAQQRSVTLRFVLRLYSLARRDGLIDETSSTYDWAVRSIIPCSADEEAGQFTSCAEWAARNFSMQTGAPTYHVVHSWGAHAEALVLGVAKAANREGPPPDDMMQLLDEKWHEQHRPDNLEVLFFICPFSVNQHLVKQHYSAGPAPLPCGHALCEIDKFAGIASTILSANPNAHMVLVICNERISLTRSCCLEEVHHALVNFPTQLYIENPMGSMQRVVIDAQSAEATDANQKAIIDRRISTDPGFATFNANVQTRFDELLNKKRRSFISDLARPVPPPKPAVKRDQGPQGPPYTIWGRIQLNVSWGLMKTVDGVHSVCRAVRTALKSCVDTAWSICFGRPGSIILIVNAEFVNLESLHKAAFRLEVAQMSGHLQKQIAIAAAQLHDGAVIHQQNNPAVGYSCTRTSFNLFSSTWICKNSKSDTKEKSVIVDPFSLHYDCQPEDIPVNVLEAEAWCDLGRVEGRKVDGQGYSAKQCYERALLADPKHSTAWDNLGFCGGGKVDGQECSQKKCYEQALLLDPKNGKAWFHLGGEGGGKVDGQECSKMKCYEQALLLAPKNVKAWFHLGNAGGAEVDGQRFSAKQCFERALLVDLEMWDKQALVFLFAREPVWDFWHNANKDHTFHMGNPWPEEQRMNIQFYAFKSPVEGTQPVYDFWHAANQDHTFHTGNPWPGEERMNLQFYAFPKQEPGTEPVYDFWHAANNEHTFHMGNPWPGEERCNVQFYAYPEAD